MDLNEPINLFALGVGIILTLLLVVGCLLALPTVYVMLLRGGYL